MSDAPRSPTATDKFIDLAQRAGKWGIAGLVFFLLQALGIFVEGASQWHSVRDAIHSFGDLAGTVGLCLTLIGVLSGIKRGNDMTATIGAESKIDRASIATALPNAPAIDVMPQSADPAVQREITKQLNGKHEQMEQAIAVAKIRNGS